MELKQPQHVLQTLQIYKNQTEDRNTSKMQWSIRLHKYPGLLLFLFACKWQITVIFELVRKSRHTRNRERTLS